MWDLLLKWLASLRESEGMLSVTQKIYIIHCVTYVVEQTRYIRALITRDSGDPQLSTP